MKTVSHKAKRRFCCLAVFFVAILFLFVGTIFQDWLAIVHNKQSIASLSEYYASLKTDEESLNSEITKLHDNNYIARYARERYMYSLPGEIIIKMPDEEE